MSATGAQERSAGFVGAVVFLRGLRFLHITMLVTLRLRWSLPTADN